MEIGKLTISVDSSSVTRAADELSRLNSEIERLLSVNNLTGEVKIEFDVADLIDQLKRADKMGYFNG